MDARAYVLLDVTDSRPGDVARVLRSRLGVVKADLLEGPPDVIFVVEASNQQELVELPTQVLASVETMTEHLQLLPTRDGYNPHILREPSMLWAQNKLAESVNNMLRAQDKLVESAFGNGQCPGCISGYCRRF